MIAMSVAETSSNGMWVLHTLFAITTKLILKHKKNPTNKALYDKSGRKKKIVYNLCTEFSANTQIEFSD